MHQLPVKLSGYIFQLLLPLRDKQDKGLSWFLPTSICRIWQDIAWSNPFLWSTIHVKLGKPSCMGPAGRISIIHDRILRTWTLPLTLHISFSSYSKDSELEGKIEAISQCSNRWESLSLEMPLSLLRKFHFNSKSNYLPLRKLQIDSYMWHWEHDIKPIPFLNSKVSPEMIDIVGIPLRSLQISWNRLSTARVDCFDLGEITQLFQHASQMTYCHISLPQPKTTQFPQSLIKG